MENTQTVNSTKIKNLITRLFYEDNQLCYQIQMICENGEQKVHRSFSDYKQYKVAYDKLLKIKTSGEYVLVEGDEVRETHVSFM